MESLDSRTSLGPRGRPVELGRPSPEPPFLRPDRVGTAERTDRDGSARFEEALRREGNRGAGDREARAPEPPARAEPRRTGDEPGPERPGSRAEEAAEPEAVLLLELLRSTRTGLEQTAGGLGPTSHAVPESAVLLPGPLAATPSGSFPAAPVPAPVPTPDGAGAAPLPADPAGVTAPAAAGGAPTVDAQAPAARVSVAPAAPPPPPHADAVLAQVRTLVRPGLSRAELELTPRELGRVQVRIELRQGELSAVLRVESREALEALQHHTPELRAAFERAELELRDLAFELTEREADAERHAGRGHREERHADAQRSRTHRLRVAQDDPRPDEHRAGAHRSDTERRIDTLA